MENSTSNKFVVEECSHCGKPMSSALLYCPHCKGMANRSKECRICGQQCNTLAAVRIHAYLSGFVPSEEGTFCDFFYHHECFSKVTGLVCSVCQTSLKHKVRHFQFDRSEICKCDNCGHSNTIVGCGRCGLSVNRKSSGGDTRHSCCDQTALKTREQCFIVSASCGPDSREVQYFRDFRDVKLCKSLCGRFVIKTYYCFAPSLAPLISKSEVLKSLTRRLLIHGSIRVIHLLENLKH